MDITHDGPHAVLIQINDKYGLPDYVKKAEDVFLQENVDKLPDRLFADPVNRRYPISSKADTWLSAAYFAKTAEDDGYNPMLKDVIRDTIKGAACIYGIEDDVKSIMDKIENPPQEKSAADDDMNYGYPDGHMYPMFDAAGVKLAGEYFEENRNNYPIDMRRTIARNIMRKAAELTVDIPDVVRREACVGMPRVDFMSIQIVDRAGRAPNEKLASAMMELNKGLLAATMSDLVPVLEKTAEAIAQFDEITGLDQQYGRTVLAPADFMFDVSTKEAEAYVEDAVQLGKYIFSLEKLAELPENVYADALGDEFVERVKTAGAIDRAKLSDELNSLPTPDKNALLESIESHTA